MEENIFTLGVAVVKSLAEIFLTAAYMRVMHLALRWNPLEVRTHGRKIQILVVITMTGPLWERPGAGASCSGGRPSPGKRCKKLLDTAEIPEPLCHCSPSVKLSDMVTSLSHAQQGKYFSNPVSEPLGNILLISFVQNVYLCAFTNYFPGPRNLCNFNEGDLFIYPFIYLSIYLCCYFVILQIPKKKK